MHVKNIRNIKFNLTVQFTKFIPKKEIYEKFEEFGEYEKFEELFGEKLCSISLYILSYQKQ